MRLISQDGDIDVPYESVYLLTEKEYICAYIIPNGIKFVMAKYVDPDELKTVLEALKFSRSMGKLTFRFPLEGIAKV